MVIVFNELVAKKSMDHGGLSVLRAETEREDEEA